MRRLLVQFSEMRDFSVRNTKDMIQEQRIQLMMSYIHTYYSEDITIDEIAGAANVSRSECFRCFKEIVRKTPILKIYL